MVLTDELHRTLGNIEGKLAYLVESFNEYKTQQKEDHKEIEARVSSVESKVNKAAAVVGFIIFLITFASDFVLTKIGLKA